MFAQGQEALDRLHLSSIFILRMPFTILLREHQARTMGHRIEDMTANHVGIHSGIW